MHTYVTHNVNFHYSSDFSGMIYIEKIDENGKVIEEISLAGNTLIDFIAHCYVLPKKLENLEQSGSDRILGL